MKLKWVQKAEEVGFLPCSLFPTRRTPVGEFLLGDEQCQLRGGNDAGKMKLSFLSFLCVLVSRLFCFVLCCNVLCSTVLLKFLK